MFSQMSKILGESEPKGLGAVTIADYGLSVDFYFFLPIFGYSVEQKGSARET